MWTYFKLPFHVKKIRAFQVEERARAKTQKKEDFSMFGE